MSDTKQPRLSLETVIEWREVTVVREEGRPPLLGCPEVKSFIEVDDDTLAVFDVVRKHPTLRAAHEALHEAGEAPEPDELVEFAEFLKERYFVRTADGAPVAGPKLESRQKTYFGNVPQQAVRWMHSPAFLLSALAIIIAGVAVVVARPELKPTYANFFIFPRLSLVIVVSFIVMLANTYVHELAHLFMARSFGVDSSIRFSRRAHIIVMETDVTNAWALPALKRSLIFLAGVGYNLLAAATFVLLAYAATLGLLPIGATGIKVLLFIAEVNTMPILFQFFFWMRTDLYFVLLCLTGERNLLADSRAYVSYLGKRLLRAVRGEFDDRCVECHRPLMTIDPFCHGCGRARETPKGSPSFAYRSRWTLLVYGIFVCVTTPLMMLYVLEIFFLFQTTMVVNSLLAVVRAIAAHDMLLAFEATLVAAITALQAGMAAYYLLPMVWGWGRKLVRRVGGWVSGTRPAAVLRARGFRARPVLALAVTASLVVPLGLVGPAEDLEATPDASVPPAPALAPPCAQDQPADSAHPCVPPEAAVARISLNG